MVGQVTPHSKAELVLVRHGQQQTMRVDVGELSDRHADTSRRAVHKARRDDIQGALGIQVSPLDAQQAAQLNTTTGGVLVRAIRRGSAAEKAGLQPGDVIVQLGFANVENPAALQQIISSLAAGSIQPIRFFRAGQPIFRSIVMP